MKRKKVIDALRWIIDILERNNVSYQIEGGLAAICYGSKRELADIDIFIPNSGFEILSDQVNNFSQFGPDWHIGKHWKLIYQILNYKGQQIELCDADNAEYFDTKNNVWIKREIDFNQAENIVIFEMKINVISKLGLIEYKTHLGRDVDIEDLKQLGTSC